MNWIRLLKVLVALAALCAIGFILYIGYTRSRAEFLVLGLMLLAAWSMFCFFFVWQGDDTHNVRRLLRAFTNQVDRARQRHRDDTRQIDDQVVKAFEQLHGEVDSLLRRHRLRMTQLRRAVTQLATRDAPDRPRWRPPTLMDMGYALTAAEQYQRGTSVLALYKLSGETRARSGEIVNTYTIVKEGVSTEFSGRFEAKVLSPHASVMAADSVTGESPRDAAHVARADVQPIGSTDSEHNVSYILSLLGPLDEINSGVLVDNLRAMAALKADTVTAPTLTLASVRGWQRSVLTERIGYLESSLPLARRALRQEPQILIAAIADLLRDPAKHWAIRMDCLAALTHILQPVSRYTRNEIERLFNQFVSQLHALESVAATQSQENPGLAFVDLRGAETNSLLFKYIAALLNTRAQGAGERLSRVRIFSNLTLPEFQAHLRGFRELNASADDQAALHTLLQGLNEEKLVLQHVTGSQVIKAKALARPAGHALHQELFCAANPAGLDLEGVAPQASYVLWTLNDHALRASVEQLLPLLELARMIQGYALPTDSSASAA